MFNLIDSNPLYLRKWLPCLDNVKTIDDIKKFIEISQKKFDSKKISFIEEDLLQDAEYLYDRFVDHLIYTILAKDWRKKEQ
ncbi:MAG: hypothetical protein WH035_00755, partial [Spirochaetota bacterium]